VLLGGCRVADHVANPRICSGTFQYGYERPVERMAVMLEHNDPNVRQLFQPAKTGWLKGDQREACATGFLLACVPPQRFSRTLCAGYLQTARCLVVPLQHSIPLSSQICCLRAMICVGFFRFSSLDCLALAVL